MRVICSLGNQIIPVIEDAAKKLPSEERLELQSAAAKLARAGKLDLSSSSRLDFLAQKLVNPPFILKKTDAPYQFEFILCAKASTEEQKLAKTALHTAAEKGSVQDIKAMLEENPEYLDARDELGRTPLAIAVEAHKTDFDRFEEVKALIIAGADVNLADKDNWTPAYRASTPEREEIFSLLVTHGADVYMPNLDGSTPLHRLADRGSIAGAKTALSRGADVNAINAHGTPLFYAAKNGNLEMAQLLVGDGRKIDADLVGDPLDLTPLAMAKACGHEDLEEYLTLLHATGEPSEALQTVMQRQVRNAVEVDEIFVGSSRDKYGRSAAHYAAAQGKLALLEKMENLDRADNKGRTPLHYAIIHGREDAVRFLIKQGADLFSQDKQGYFPLEWSCQYHREEIAKILLEAAEERGKAEEMVSQQDNFKWSAYQKAAHHGNLAIVSLLIERYGVDPEEKTPDGRTALFRAEAAKAVNVAEYIQAAVRKKHSSLE